LRSSWERWWHINITQKYSPLLFGRLSPVVSRQSWLKLEGKETKKNDYGLSGLIS
jgi:hypothetical protein